MQNHQTPAFMDTVPVSDGPHAPSSGKADATAADFYDATRPGDLWPEAADAQCSEHATLFADSQPSPLTVV